MSGAFDSSVSASDEVMSSTLSALVPGIGEGSSALIAFWKFIRSRGSAINLCRSIARRFLITPFGRFGAMRPKRRILPIMTLWSDPAFSLGGGSITYQSSIHLPCRYLVKPVLGLFSVRTMSCVRYTKSRCRIERFEEGEFVISCVDQ